MVVYALDPDTTVADADLDAPPSMLVIIADALGVLVALGAIGAWIAGGRRRREPVV
jgi:hypothetical protein